ncbi:trehalose utilization protein ThuA [Bacilli bacterium]|nr:trehalose utilization protein ThuA [Bacilli bacterium]
MSQIKVTVWNEYFANLPSPASLEEAFGGKSLFNLQKRKEVADVYPEGLHKAIADFLNKDNDIKAGVSIISDPEQGLSEQVLNNTDVLVWWGHMYHHLVEDRFVQRVADRVQRGMGIIFLHSAHRSKPFVNLLGTSGRLSWREADERCRVWTANPAHPIAAGIPTQFVIDKEEMYSEPFGIPEPDSTVFISWYEGGNVFRSGVTYHREYGKVFYFQPGHETYPNYHNETVQKVITNAVKWARPTVIVADRECPNDKIPLEKIG